MQQPSFDRDLARASIDTTRLLAADMVEKAQSVDHPGTPMEAAPIAYLLYQRQTCATTRPIPHGPGVIASSSPAAMPRRCSTACSTSAVTPCHWMI